MKRKLRKVEYDKNIIKNILNTYKGLKPKDVHLFFDMDNTLFIFSVNSRDDISLKLQENEGFFKNLKPMNGAPETLLKLKDLGFNIYILSACMDNEYCEKEKKESLHIHFPFIDEKNMIFTKHGENKAERITSMGIDIKKSILIDDYYVNLLNWMELGGLAIKKTFSGKKREIPQIKEYQVLENILFEIIQ